MLLYIYCIFYYFLSVFLGLAYQYCPVSSHLPQLLAGAGGIGCAYMVCAFISLHSKHKGKDKKECQPLLYIILPVILSGLIIAGM